MGLTNTRTVRIEWGHCDPAGIVFYPRYFEIFDACTERLFERAVGMSRSAMTTAYAFLGTPMVDMRVRFLQPSAYGDEVAIETTVIEFRGASFDVRHRLYGGEALAVECFETRVWAERDPERPAGMRGKRVPDEIRRLFETD